ncbi:MAG: hypothetical protein IJ789_08970 [Bacteroidales bacterium]|nr:hypothetical protein [Bacteroidales bacterium]
MATFDEGILGGFSGRVGNVVGYRWRGRWVMRSLPQSVANPRTEKQTAHRELFKFMVQTAAKLRDALRLGMRTVAAASAMTERNYFVKCNKQCFSLVDGAMEVDYPSLMVSDGELASPQFGSVEVGEGLSLTAHYVAASEGVPARSGDYVYLFAVCPDLGLTRLSLPAYRNSKSLTISLEDEWRGHELHLYGFATGPDGEASASCHLWAGTLAEDGSVVKGPDNQTDTRPESNSDTAAADSEPTADESLNEPELPAVAATIGAEPVPNEALSAPDEPLVAPSQNIEPEQFRPPSEHFDEASEPLVAEPSTTRQALSAAYKRKQEYRSAYSQEPESQLDSGGGEQLSLDLLFG